MHLQSKRIKNFDINYKKNIFTHRKLNTFLTLKNL